MITSFPPFLIFFLGAVLASITFGRTRSIILLAVPVLGALNLMQLGDGPQFQVQLFDYTLTLVRVDKLSFLFGLLFHIAALLGIIFALHTDDRLESTSGLIYAGSTIGAVFAGDMITLFIFWELMALSSAFMILARRTEKSLRAAMRYLTVQVTSGVILLAGVLIWSYETGSIAFDYIGLDGLASWLILLAFGIKCCFPFLHNWLTDAYPEASPTATVILSAFSTKLAVYALARAFPGTEVLIYIGATMAVFPIFFAAIENDLRRVLAYALINQLGFMVVGIGLGTALAINGAVSYAFIYKGLLFMAMGAVLYRTGKVNGSDLGGLYKSMPWTATLCIVGAASISSFPLFAGFVAKSMVITAALSEGYPIIWMALLFASASVFPFIGIKIPFFAFFAHDSGIRTREAPRNMLVAMGLAAALSVFIGVYPSFLYNLLPMPVDYEPYTAAHVLTQMQILLFSALAFVWLQKKNLYPPELPGINLDVEWIYRKALPAVAVWVVSLGAYFRIGSLAQGQRWIERTFNQIYRHHGPNGIFARTWATGSAAFWTTVMLAIYLLLYFSGQLENLFVGF